MVTGSARLRKWSFTGCILVWMLLGGGVACGQQTTRPLQIRDLRQLEGAFVRLAKQVKPSTAAIETYVNGQVFRRGDRGTTEESYTIPMSHGSGAIIDADGYILTNAHVIEGADEIKVRLADGRRFDARLVQADQRSDLAVLQIPEAGLKPVRWGDLTRVQQGQWCFAMGNPFGVANEVGDPSLTYGIISGLDRDLSRELNPPRLRQSDVRYYGELIQTSAAINPGNSGGPLFNIDGEMIGVVTAIATETGVTEGLGFAIPINRRNRRVIDTLRTGEQVTYGYLGISMSDRDDANDIDGSLVTALEPRDGPAARAGIMAGDIIVGFDGRSVTNNDQLIRIIGATPTGKPTEIVFLRDGRRHVTTVTLDRREVSSVLVGGNSHHKQPRTLVWRGALISEPTDAHLQEAGLSRDEFGLVVVQVNDDSAAAQAGLEAEAVIFRVGRRRVKTIDDFLSAEADGGRETRLNVYQDGRRFNITVPAMQTSL